MIMNDNLLILNDSQAGEVSPAGIPYLPVHQYRQSP